MGSHSVYLTADEERAIHDILGREKLADTIPDLLANLVRSTIKEYAPKGKRA